MDNVTHSLIGHALGRALGARAGSSVAARRAAIWSSVLASNLPDLDFVIRPFAHDSKLAYLLHHRGHTHTLLVAVPLGLVVAALCSRAFRVAEAEGRRMVRWAAVLASLLHIGFDGLNNYGVHPFFPFDNRWYYGDAVFIIEPLLLAVLLPQLALCAQSRSGRVLGYALSAGLLALLWLRPEASVGVATASSAVLAAAFVGQRAWRMRALPALVASGLVVLVFALGALRAKQLTYEALARALPEERVVQLVTTPLPGQPLCWDLLAVTFDAHGTYRARLGALSLWPSVLDKQHCRFVKDQTTAPLRAVPLDLGPALSFFQLYEAPLVELRALRRAHCTVAAALQFMRAPFWLARPSSVIGDLRYDREPGLGFAELAVQDDCRDPLPPWVPPLTLPPP